MTEASASFDCFGSTCSVHVTGADAEAAVAAARRSLLAWHDTFTRFATTSELSRLNADPRPAVEVSAILARFVSAALEVSELTGGLVDATQLARLEAAGYRRDLTHPLPLELALALAPPRQPAGPAIRRPAILLDGRTVHRTPGVQLDSGGVVKGLLADVLADTLSHHEAFAVNCAGDLRLGGTPREVHVASPFDGSTLHTFTLGSGGVATSGIGRRSWLSPNGRPAHHLLDPATGRPAFTGVVQATALAPTALLAEARAKAAVLAGPADAPRWLPDGGVLVLDDASPIVFAAVALAA